jgi:hypothetical protein
MSNAIVLFDCFKLKPLPIVDRDYGDIKKNVYFEFIHL